METIKNTIKDLSRDLLNYLHLDLTKNLEYDRLTRKIMKMTIRENSNCIDVGCHKGEMLDTILKLSPDGKHFAFEPIPPLYEFLKDKYSLYSIVLPYALSDSEGTTTFQYVKNAPAYSGINKRKYAVETPDIQEIEVEMKRLDNVIPAGTKIDFIKIDVEGGEFGVMKGASEILKKYKPIVIFESGLGASEYYGTQPEDLYNFLTEETGLKISLLKSWINKEQPLTMAEFKESFDTNSDYYFIAHP
jgi:FkbM family methyltransferase